jgi:hypothetical protein
MALNIARSLRIAICEYEYRNGAAPVKIFAELDAYYALQDNLVVEHHQNQNITICGIQLEPIPRPGTEIYLCADPVPIRDIPTGDIRIVFHDGTEVAL